MKMTKKDHDARVARLADGTSPDPDDDRRLVKLYNSQAHEEPPPAAETVNGSEYTSSTTSAVRIPAQRRGRGKSL